MGFVNHLLFLCVLCVPCASVRAYFQKCFRRHIKVCITIIFLVFVANGVIAQEPVLLAYQQNFIRSSLEAKAGVLLDAAADDRANDSIGPLYNFALDFAVKNAEYLGDDPHLINIAVLAAQGVGKIGYRESVDSLLEIFTEYRNSMVRVEVINSLEILGKGNARVRAYLNQYLADQNKLQRSRMNVDYPAVSACINALEFLGGSFSPLFGVMVLDYPDEIKIKARAAMESLPGDLRQFLTEVIMRNSPAEKLYAFRIGTSSNRFSTVEQGQLAEKAIEQALDYPPADIVEEALLADLGHEAVLCLSRLQWSRANSLVIRYFYRIQGDYLKGNVFKERLVQAITCLGAMRTSEAAAAAGIQLALINAQTEKTGAYDEAITLALIKALGTIGDKSAFDHLLYINYLPYSDNIEAAAKEALESLRW